MMSDQGAVGECAHGLPTDVPCDGCAFEWEKRSRTEIAAATNFQLGYEGDNGRPWISVSRQYGSSLYPIPPWVVYLVTPFGVRTDTKREFDTQRAALDYGHAQLAELRSGHPNSVPHEGK